MKNNECTVYLTTKNGFEQRYRRGKDGWTQTSPSQVWLVRRRDFRMISDPFTKSEQGLTRFTLEGRFGVAFPQPSAVQVFSIVTP